MPKHKEYTILLLSHGIWDEGLHFAIIVILKACEFITEVVQSNSAFGPYPGYICKCGEIQSDICETATVAISSVYHQLFKTKTKFSGPEVLGFDKTIITDELLSDLLFHPYNFQLGILRIWIVRIGSNEITTNLAGPGFKSAFIYQYNKSRALFFQEIDKNHCRVTIYYECNACIDFIEQNLDLVWSKIGILWQYNRNQLFGLTNQYTKNLIQAAQILWTSVANLNPIWDRGSGNNTLPGNSNWFEWQWPTTGEFSRCIKAWDIPGIGEWKIFTIAELDKFRKKDIHKPTPQVLTHTTSSSEWEMLMPNSSRLIPSRLTRESLVKELEKRNFRFNNKENKDQLINLLENQLVEDTKKAKIAHNQTNSISNKENRHIFEVDKFSLNSGWALKANQKFERKGTSPEIRALLEG
ncbi:1242_t:CDS:2, partial [Dentiscutata erythropus]